MIRSVDKLEHWLDICIFSLIDILSFFLLHFPPNLLNFIFRSFGFLKHGRNIGRGKELQNFGIFVIIRPLYRVDSSSQWSAFLDHLMLVSPP